MSGPSLEAQVLDLASSRPDKIPVKTRNERINLVTKCLVEMAGDRAKLAAMNDIKCSSRHAYQRIAGLICTAIDNEDNHSEIQTKLCKQLCT